MKFGQWGLVFSFLTVRLMAFMKIFSSFCLTAFFSVMAYGQKAYTIDNPVLPGVRDVGAIQFNGEYYLGGMGTEGGFYISEDMVHWKGPIHVLSMDNAWTDGESAKDHQIHAGDINYINGTFHYYWSVNYWGTDVPTVHIGHAIASDILGPYTEPEKDTWFDNRIDAELFIDDDRQPYFYTVKFTDGNTIWVDKMQNPGALSGNPQYVFASSPHTWETYDSRVAEGPWVIKYRNTYYLMYNANHTAPGYGNYALGVATADDPLGFHHGSKYPYPVVASNQVYLEDHFVDLLKYTEKEPGIFAYTLHAPSKNWTQRSFTTDAWQKGKGGFGHPVIENSSTRKVNTHWNSDEIWLRKTFVLPEEDEKNLLMRIHHAGDTEVYLNGNLIYEKKGNNYMTWHLDEPAKTRLKKGENVVAVHTQKAQKSAFVDVSLFDMKDQTGDDILYVSGQPSIVRGPNGFEWWLVYFTMKNGNPPGQFIDRVHFFNKELYVDGPTGKNTPGYHPPPAKPTFGDNFNDADPKQFEHQWKVISGQWNLQNKELIQTGSSTGQLLVNSTPSSHYLFEAGVKSNDQNVEAAGVYAYWKDEHNWLKVILDPKEKKWAYTINENGKQQIVAYDLFSDFNFNAYHTLTICKNAHDFTVAIDHLPAPGNKIIITHFDGEGIAGLYTEGGQASFDGVLYTIGWDEFDDTIRGWSASASGSKESGTWAVTSAGLAQTQASGAAHTFKGDLLEYYDFSVQVAAAGLPNNGKAGMYAVYIDAENYLKAVIDYQKQALVVSGKKNGEEIASQEVSLQRRHPCFVDMRHSDFVEKHFTFQAPAAIDAIEFYKSPHFMADTLIEDIHQHVNISYKSEGQWHPLPPCQKDTTAHPAFDKITFEPIKTESLRMVNKLGENYVYKIYVHEQIKSAYNLRAGRQEDEIIFVVDGKEVLRMKNQWGAAQVGLLTEDMKANFNGIMLYHLPQIQ